MENAKTVFFIVCLRTITAISMAQEQGIYIYGAELKMGMRRSIIIDLLASQNLYLQEEEDYILVWDKKPGTADREILGNLRFREEALVYVNKDWGHFRSADAFDLADALSSLLGNFNDKGKYIARVELRNMIRDAKHKSDQISIQFNERSIIIDLIDDRENGKVVQISERLQEQSK